MSLENAILELAAGMKDLAAAVRERSAPLGDLAATAEAAIEEIKGSLVEPIEKSGKMPGAKDPEIEQAVQKVEEAAKEEQAEAVELDYTKDVRPVLLAVNKKAGQPALKALLTQFGAATGDKLTADQYADVLVEANKILAA